MNKFYAFAVLFLLGFAVLGQTKKVCFTIDDLPVVSYGDNDQFYLWNITLNIISKCDKLAIPAIGFVNEGNLFKEGVLDSSQLDLLKLWFQNGYEIGNHTYSHQSYNSATIEEFKEEILTGEAISRHLEQEYNKELRYFRHPFLQVGETKEKYEALNSFLASKNYITAPVTMVNQDWVFAEAYAKAEKIRDRDLMAEIGEAYIQFSDEMIKLAERQSEKLFNRNISHTLLIHSNRLNADYLDELGGVFIENGYEFVSLEEALDDKAYQTEITYFKTYGTSWLTSWSQSQSRTEGFDEGSPQIPEWIKNLE